MGRPRKLSDRQRSEIVATCALRDGVGRPRYGIQYVAALHGVSTAYVTKLTRRAGQRRRLMYAEARR